jgi:sortase A
MSSFLLFIIKGGGNLKNKLVIVGIFFFMAGIGFSSYSLLSIYRQEYSTNEALEKAKAAIFEDQTLTVNKRRTEQSSVVEYNFKQGDVIGILAIPKLGRELPIIEGTDGEELKRGVGHYSTTKFPDQNDQIFLAGHRDSVFRNIGELEKGDILTVKMKTGTFTYQIFNSYIVDENDLTVIRSTNPDEILTLSTCYPFNIVGNSPERYILEAKRAN